MLELEYAELHGPFFLKGTNLPAKLVVGDGPGKRRDIKLFYDRVERELYVHFKDTVGIVPRENVACMVEKGAELIELSKKTPIAAQARVSAQVEGPQSHVFAGAGHGKSRDK
jgi:hypothetical protein